MVGSVAEYSLSDGYVHNWLVAGPRVAPAGAEAVPPPASDDVRETARWQIGPDTLTWRYATAAADHLVDVSGWLRSPGRLEAWAYAQVASTSTELVEASVLAYAPPEVWVGAARVEPYAAPEAAPRANQPWRPRRWLFRLPLQAARNALTVRFTRLPGAASPTAFALQLRPSAASAQRSPLRVLLPFSLAPELLRDRALFETALDSAYLERDIYLRGERVGLKWATTYDNWVRLTARLQTPAGLIFAEAFDVQTAPGRPIQKPSTLVDGPYEVYVQPNTREYHDERRLRVSRALPLWLSNTDYAQTPTGTPASRRAEALTHAARHKGQLFAELAKMALSAWDKVDARVLRHALEQIAQWPEQHLSDLVALLGVRHRYATAPSFPPDVLVALDACVGGVDYTPTPPATEGHDGPTLLRLAAEVLAGQLYPEQAFVSDGQTGRWHQQRGEQAALAWLRQRGTMGLDDWDNAKTIQDLVVALTHLVALADNDDLAELASVLLDKSFFSLAVNSFRGTFGAAHSRTDTAAILTGRMEPTAGLSWLLWGQGTLNHHLAGLISLALCQEYQLPEVVAAIAADQPAELLSRAAHDTGHTVTYKTPDYMFSSAQDDAPGAPGDCEHVWQATLGPDALVFTNQPANLSLADWHRPNFWRGNVARPRVAQWRDALMAIYTAPPEGDGLGFTHAHFPLYAFDEHALADGWAFARRGEGYVALRAAHGLVLVTTGDGAQRELRSPGAANVWLCQMGRAALDGSFAEFQARVRALPVSFEAAAARWTTLRGDALAFDWQGPLEVNGSAQVLDGVQQYDNPYTVTARGAMQMDIMHDGQGVRLVFDEVTGGA